MPKYIRTNAILEQLTPELAAEIFKEYARPETTLKDLLKKYPFFSEHQLRYFLKGHGMWSRPNTNPYYRMVEPEHITKARRKFYTKGNKTKLKKKSAPERFDDQSKILADAFRARLAYCHALDACKKAGLDEAQVNAFFELFGEGDFNAAG